MCKFFKIILLSIFFLTSSAFAADSRYVLYPNGSAQSGQVEKQSVHSHEPTEVNIMQLDNMVPNYDKSSNDSQGITLRVNPIPNAARVPVEGIVYETSDFPISHIDPKTGENGINTTYPGFRGANELIVYTPTYGLRTGTNEFGSEASVVGNTVVKFGGADSIIPNGGFVISGHGKAKTWIQKNLLLGAKIYVDFDKKRVYSYITPDTYVFEVNEKIKDTQAVMNYYRMMDAEYDGRRAISFLNRAKDYLRRAERRPDRASGYITQAKVCVNSALENAIPYREDEFKGIWIRPVEHNETEIALAVEKLKEAGVKNVFLETYFHGMTIYPSEVMARYGFVPQRGEFIGFDPLAVWIKECHKHDIKLHIWFETFYLGNKPPRCSQKHILSVNPEWANKTKILADSDEISKSSAEWNGYFLDPANPEVQQFLCELMSEMFQKYRPDGINLDYIRYPLGAQNRTDASKGTEWGYTKIAREEFQELYGVDPVTLKVADPLRKVWFEYRQNKITDFVEITRNLTKKYNVTFTTVVFTDKTKSLETKMQDWQTWSRRNLVDAFTPMILTTDRKTASTIVREMKNSMTPSTKLYMGIYVMYMDAPVDELLMQIHEMRKMHANGVVFFDYAHFAEKYRDALSVRAFNPERR